MLGPNNGILPISFLDFIQFLLADVQVHKKFIKIVETTKPFAMLSVILKKSTDLCIVRMPSTALVSFFILGVFKCKVKITAMVLIKEFRAKNTQDHACKPL